MIMPNPDGTPKEGDERNVNGNMQVFHNHRWHSKPDSFDTEGFMGQQGATRPKDVPPPKQRKPHTLGTGMPVGKPWNYKSPMDYLIAYSVRPAKTKAGRFLFNTFNTLSWMNNWYRGKKDKRVTEEQSKAVNDGFESALKNVNDWLDGIDPSTDLDSVDSATLSKLHRNLQQKESELASKYESVKGNTDPESLRIKAEYKVYADMFAKMDKDLQRQREVQERARMNAERERQRMAEDAERERQRRAEDEEQRRRLKERLNRLNQDKPKEE